MRRISRSTGSTSAGGPHSLSAVLLAVVLCLQFALTSRLGAGLAHDVVVARYRSPRDRYVIVVVLGAVWSVMVVVGTGCSVMVVKIARWTVVVVAGDEWSVVVELGTE